jgi:hypothetical protein
MSGFMGSLLLSAFDPAFFMIHATVDMLWHTWQVCNNVVPWNDNLETSQDPRVWMWTDTTRTFGGTMPYMEAKRTPKTAHSIEALGYKYTNSFINNVLGYVGAGWCQGSGSSGGFTSALFLQAQERLSKRQSIYHDPNNPPRVLATSFLEAHTHVENLNSNQKWGGKSKALKGAQTRKKGLAILRGTLAKPGCYTPKKDEVASLKNFGSIYKKVRKAKGGGFAQAVGSVIDAECLGRNYATGLVASNEFIEAMGMTKARAQGKFHHQCYLRYNTAKGDNLKTNYTRDGEKKSKPRLPKNVPIVAPRNFVPMGDNPPAPPATVALEVNSAKEGRFARKQSALGPI